MKFFAGVSSLLSTKVRGPWHVKLSRIVTWSSLSKVGKAPAMRLTVLVPLIGVFLLFNQQTEQLFQFPAFFVEDIGVADGSATVASNLYFTYFGLCFLGFASFLFSMFCPQEISDQPVHREFVSQATSTETPVLSKASFRQVLDLHFQSEFDEELPDNPNYPSEIEGDFHALMEGMYSDYDLGDMSGDQDGLPEVMTATGYLDFTEFARMLWSNPRVVWAYTLPFFDLAPKYAKDIAYVKFQALNHSMYRVRTIIACSYLTGFGLLLVPTMKVFVLLGYGLLLG
jgi:hypothetical protein